MCDKSYNHNPLDHTCGVSDDELSHRFKEAVRIENEIKKQTFKIKVCLCKIKLFLMRIKSGGAAVVLFFYTVFLPIRGRSRAKGKSGI